MCGSLRPVPRCGTPPLVAWLGKGHVALLWAAPE